ncbi:MAG: tryptophan 7-halogenase [Woeseiaceae bacterium]|nr:tryptophan 7-halogenase [Woeseiaceae bacterium]
MKPIKKIVIVGGGSSGWITASILAHDFRPDVLEIELVESEEIGTIGVGESTVPSFVGLIKNLDIDLQHFIQSVHATFKLGIEFPDWHRVGESYFHPFGWIGTSYAMHDFYQIWLKAKSNGHSSELQTFAPCSVMARERRFLLPEEAPNTPLGSAGYALHIDAALVAKYLRGYAEGRKVRRTEGLVTEVRQNEDGSIASLLLKNGEEVHGDFFIDCTGFYALLIEKTLGIGYEDWLNYLPVDRAVAVQTENLGEALPYTVSTARDSGWSWRIPLQHRTGNGYVYSSEFCSDDEATEKLLDVVDGKTIIEPRIIPFRAGVRKSFWHKNCLSVGLSSGFIEPLEATALHVVLRGVGLFLRYYPDRDCEQALIDEYNRHMLAEYELIRDFIVLHYCLTEREDTPFWKHRKHTDIPPSLAERIELFKAHGTLREGNDQLWQASSWQSVFEGMGVRPEKYSPKTDNLDYEWIRQNLDRMESTIRTTVEGLPTHDQYLRERFGAI